MLWLFAGFMLKVSIPVRDAYGLKVAFFSKQAYHIFYAER